MNANVPLVSDTPSYHSTVQHVDTAPIDTRTVPENESTPQICPREPNRPVEIGLPPVSALPSNRELRPFTFRPWSAADTPTAIHYRKVAERRIVDGRCNTTDHARRHCTRPVDRLIQEQNAARKEAFRPLEDPYLVGEQAAAEAKRDRLERERSNTTLQQEAQHWDWLIGEQTTYSRCKN